MFKIFKYLKLLSCLQNVTDAYEGETGKKRPPYLSRRFWGALVVFVGAALGYHFGVEIDENILTNITESIGRIIAAGTVLYGLVMEVVGIVKAKKK